MADLNKVAAIKELPHVGVHGNMSVKLMTLTVDAAQNDVVFMGWIPGRSWVLKAVFDNGALGASVTGKAGYVKKDASGSMTDDDDAFFAATSWATAATTTFEDGTGIWIEEDALIVVTLEGADPSAGTIACKIEYNNERR